jgi:hypothetical protein
LNQVEEEYQKEWEEDLAEVHFVLALLIVRKKEENTKRRH